MDPAQRLFVINEKNGEIKVRSKEALKADHNQQYTITVEAYDSSKPKNVATARVIIKMKRNENKPTIDKSEYRITMNDTWALGSFLIDLNATDKDGDSLYYELRGEDRARKFYYLDAQTGVITLKTLMSEGVQTEDRIQIRIRDQATPEKYVEVRVIVTIKRDRRNPKFDSRTVRASVRDTTKVNSTINTSPNLKANDDDKRGNMQYEIVGDYPGQSFIGIKKNSGQLYVLKDLRTDTLKTSGYTLKVISYDSVYPQNRASATVSVSVIRNANEPKFEKSSYTKTISEDFELGVSVIDVKATDADGVSCHFYV